MKQRLVVIGNGMAGMRAVEELLALGPSPYDITVFGAEPHGNYNRILLSPVLAGELTLDEIMLNRESWYAKRGITLRKGKTVVRIDRSRRFVVAADGTKAEYDRLLIATGSLPILLPIPGNTLEGVVTFRDIADVGAMLLAARRGKRAVVIGGGLLGLEAAHGLLKRGMQVTVIHLVDHLMERQLDSAAGELLRRSLQERRLAILAPAETEAILGEKRVRAVRLKGGGEIAADIVVMAVGIRPNIALAQSAGLHCRRGIVVNDAMQSYDPRIYAVGECVEHRGLTYGLVAPLFDQAKVCANHLALIGHASYRGSLNATKLKVTGIDVFSAGDFAGGPEAEELVFHDAAQGIYRKLVLADNRVRGAIAYGDTVDDAWYLELMRDRTDVSAFRDRLLFGQAWLGDSGDGAIGAATAGRVDE